MKTYYDLLDVAVTATEQEIKSAYRRLARKYHPDFNNGDKACEERFKQIDHAYKVILGKVKPKKTVVSQPETIQVEIVATVFVAFTEVHCEFDFSIPRCEKVDVLLAEVSQMEADIRAIEANAEHRYGKNWRNVSGKNRSLYAKIKDVRKNIDDFASKIAKNLKQAEWDIRYHLRDHDVSMPNIGFVADRQALKVYTAGKRLQCAFSDDEGINRAMNFLKSLCLGVEYLQIRLEYGDKVMYSKGHDLFGDVYYNLTVTQEHCDEEFVWLIGLIKECESSWIQDTTQTLLELELNCSSDDLIRVVRRYDESWLKSKDIVFRGSLNEDRELTIQTTLFANLLQAYYCKGVEYVINNYDEELSELLMMCIR